MRALVQRVSKGSVTVDGETIGRIDKGLVILLGVRHEDTEAEAKHLAEKCANLRIFSDENDNLHLSCLDVGGEVLAVSQFTLYADTRKGRRPSFIQAASPEISEPLYKKFISYLKEMGIRVEEGVFGAVMQVEILNDGPVTILVESK
ncbi:D-tyrosyl-tRNA(Tyr) deacylase [candidate division KSB1 bacterium]|nr:D-tyrosyl-tRNA(Tyr) deacylase [candidate division KSB1 bacterium]NIR68471.1 D-tyrosyl-tRNA(Tyr) deacylase [candidate division KSB1 bacterium]NIS25122.1 D-tyrosyl-tRNA(Tyr) deacylase [candidate division KSB1 bacterium]NIT72034.1 D-tyrosyl-tRNA(Tyr) deacylase [candidate division KSB1 bacterium]NIU25821.1 D-tyrosyl-tRNA(Tyr) deacylase [candidate division KSB1 bacterium]